MYSIVCIVLLLCCCCCCCGGSGVEGRRQSLLEEEVVLYPLHHNNDGDDDSSWFIHGSFRTDGYLSGSDWQYVPAGIEGLMVEEGGLAHIDVTYTRGNRGDRRLPSWYMDRAPGLVVEYRPLSGANKEVVMRMLGRLLGCSASSLVTSPRKSFVVENETFVGVSTTDFPCVESIEQWMKLLPCGGQRGLGSIFESLHLVETPYHSMKIVAVYNGDGAVQFRVEMSAIVHRDTGMHGWSRRRHGGVHVNSVLEHVVGGSGVYPWEFQCPIVSTSDVYIHRRGLDGPIQGCRTSLSGTGVRCPMYTDDTRDTVPNSLIDVQENVEVTNWLVGRLDNPLLASMTCLVATGSAPSVMRYRQIIPWEIVYDPSSLRILHGDELVWFRGKKMGEGVHVDWISPAPRQHAGLLEVVLEGARKDVRIEMHVERTVLSVFDYPPDVSRGIDIPAPVVRLQNHRQGEIVVAGQNILFHLPIPDASMPFNVACFTATLISLIFGSVIQMALWSPEELEKMRSEKNSVKKRLMRLVLVSVVGGSVVLYIDPSSQAIALVYLEKVQRAVFGHDVV